MTLSREIDRKGFEQMKGFWIELGRSCKEILKLRHIPEIYLTILFLLTNAMFNPVFSEYGFYYMTNVRHISKIQLGVVDTVASFANLGGVLIFFALFKEWEFRTLLFGANIVNLLCNISMITFIKGWNHSVFGISDIHYVYLQTMLFLPLNSAMYVLPLAILFVKICPKSIEGTAYAILVGLNNLC